MAERRPTPPRFRVEERRPDRAAYSVGLADTPLLVRSLVALGTTRLLRARAAGEVVVVDQETEAAVLRQRVGYPTRPAPGGRYGEPPRHPPPDDGGAGGAMG